MRRLLVILIVGVVMTSAGCGADPDPVARAPRPPTSGSPGDPAASRDRSTVSEADLLARPGVYGWVTSSGGAPVGRAFVEPTAVEGTTGPVPELAVFTDDDGRYRWSLGPGTWAIRVSAEGYRTTTGTVRVVDGPAVLLDLVMERE